MTLSKEDWWKSGELRLRDTKIKDTMRMRLKILLSGVVNEIKDSFSKKMILIVV